MSLLDNQDLVEIFIYYKYVKENGIKRLVILEDSKADNILKNGSDEEKELIDILKTKWSSLTWKEQNDITNSSSQTINHQTGEKQFNFVSYRDAVVKKCLKEWNLTINEKPIPVTPDAIDKLPGSIVINLYQKFEAIVDYTDKELGN